MYFCFTRCRERISLSFLRVPKRPVSAVILKSVCDSDFSIGLGGRDDCRRHVASKKHTDYASLQSGSKSISSFFAAPKETFNVTKAETIMMDLITQLNLPIAAADKFTKAFKVMFPDSDIAKKFQCGRSKGTAIIKELSSDKG